MIRLIQRRLIVPRGDTGTFSIPVLAGKDTGDASVFTIFNPLTHRKIFEKVMQLSDGVLTMDLSHGDTVNLPVGQFVWDIKFYTNPTIADGHIVDGEEVDSYYAAFTLPVCEIRETGDNLLMSDEAPQATLSPGQVDYITASINEVTSSKNAAASSAAEADTSATNAETSASAAAVSEQAAQDSQEAALASQQAAQTAAEQAIASAEAAAETAAQIEADLEAKANIADLDDVAFSGDYNDLSNTPSIPSIEGLATVQYVDEKTEKVIAHFPVHSEEELAQDLTCSHTIAELYEAYSSGKTIMGSLDLIGLETQSILMESSITFGGRPIIKFQTDMVGDADAQLVIVGGSSNNQDVWHLVQRVGLVAYKNSLMDASPLRFTTLGGTITDVSAPVNNTDVANKQYVDNTIPTNVSQLANDAGYLTQHQDISGKADSADLATVATSGSYNDLENKPFIPNKVSDLTDDSGHYTKPANGIPATDMTSGVQTSLGLADTAYQKPNNGIPASDLASGVIPSVPVQDVQIKNTSILNNGVANIPLATNGAVGLVQGNNTYGTAITAAGDIMIYRADDSAIKNGNGEYKPIVPYTEHQAVFYGLAKAAGDTTQRASQNNVGIYTSSAKSAIQAMLDVPSTSSVASSIASAIGNVNSFDMVVVQELPTQDISTHTIYLVPKTGETNDVYDEYIYINNAWEMIGNTQIDLSSKADKVDTVLNTTLSRGRKTNTLSGSASIAFGSNVEASGIYSIAYGKETIAAGSHQSVFGRYNQRDIYPNWAANTHYNVGDAVFYTYHDSEFGDMTGLYICNTENTDTSFVFAHWDIDQVWNKTSNYVEIVGNGTADNVRSNAYALEWDGTGRFAGNVYIGCNSDSTGGTKVLCEADFATDAEIQNIINGGAGA